MSAEGGDSSARIWALVSGFPETKRRRRQLLMLQAYIDGSGTTLAGYIATAEKWAAFADDWQRMLDMRAPNPLPHFKMKERTRDLERCGWFYGVIEKHVSVSISCTIHKKALQAAIDDAKKKYGVLPFIDIGNTYLWAFRTITIGLAKFQRQGDLCMDEPVDFIFDNEKEKTQCLIGWDVAKRSLPRRRSKLMGDTPIFRDDTTVLPLQAADLYAYWIRQWEMGKPVRFPWAVTRDIPQLNVKPNYAIEIDQLMRFRWYDELVYVGSR